MRVSLVTRSGRELVPGGLDVKARRSTVPCARSQQPRGGDAGRGRLAASRLTRAPVAAIPIISPVPSRRVAQGSTVDDLKRALHEASLKKQARARARLRTAVATARA